MLVIPDQNGNIDTRQVEVVFVSDMFAEEYAGGAELTSEALIEACPMRVLKLKSQYVNLETLQALSGAYWVFGNFSAMSMELVPSIVANVNYSILEYDYKFCKYRSPEKHQYSEGTPCDCR